VVHKDGAVSLISFVEAPPDSVTISTKEILTYGRTQAFALSASTDVLKMQYTLKTINSSNMLQDADATLSFNLIDIRGGKTVSTIGTRTIVKSSDTTTTQYELAVSAGSIPNFSASTEIAIDLALSGVKTVGPNLIASLGHVYRLAAEGGADLPKALIAEDLVPETYLLRQNYPNPFNPSTTIRYVLPHRSHVVLTVFNIVGQRVAELVNGDVDAGEHEVRFNASQLASGVYFYRLQLRPPDSARGRYSESGAGSFMQTKKLVLVR
jgi:hypothetical protein